MRNIQRSFGTLTLASLLVLLLGIAPLHAGERAAAPADDLAAIPPELAADGQTLPSEDCDTAADLPALELQPPTATPASDGTSTFYVCLDNDFLCGGCPTDTRCVTEACGSQLSPSCTFQTSCRTGCVLTTCQSLAESCGTL